MPKIQHRKWKELIQAGKKLNPVEIHKIATIVIYNNYNCVFPAKHLREHFGCTHKRVLDAFKGKAPMMLYKINKYVNSIQSSADTIIGNDNTNN